MIPPRLPPFQIRHITHELQITEIEIEDKFAEAVQHVNQQNYAEAGKVYRFMKELVNALPKNDPRALLIREKINLHKTLYTSVNNQKALKITEFSRMPDRRVL